MHQLTETSESANRDVWTRWLNYLSCLIEPLELADWTTWVFFFMCLRTTIKHFLKLFTEVWKKAELKANMRSTQKQHNVCWQWDFLPNKFPKLPSYLWKSLRIWAIHKKYNSGDIDYEYHHIIKGLYATFSSWHIDPCRFPVRYGERGCVISLDNGSQGRAESPKAPSPGHRPG